MWKGGPKTPRHIEEFKPSGSPIKGRVSKVTDDVEEWQMLVTKTGRFTMKSKKGSQGDSRKVVC